MSDTDDAQARRRETLQSQFKSTLAFLMMNRDIAIRILVKELHAPDEFRADSALTIFFALLAQVVLHLETDELIDISEKEKLQ